MSLSLNGTDGVTFNDGSEQWAAASPIGTKNIVINGNMQIAQRGTSKTGITTGGYYTVDRFQMSMSGLGTWTMAQDTNVPSGQGFSNSLKLSCTTADASPAAGDYFNLQYKTEAQNLQHLLYGTSSAKTMTLSFWVKSNKTGTYQMMFYAPDNSPARMLSKSYTIDAADTWEKKTITVDGDTSGNFNNDNGNGLSLYWYFGVGSNRQGGTSGSWADYVTANEAPDQTVNLADSTSNYWQLTGVQLEVGDTATPFEVMPYDMQLARCQRYYNRIYDIWCDHAVYVNGGRLTTRVDYPVQMRANPTVTTNSVSNTNCTFQNSNRTNTNGTHLYANSTTAAGDVFFVINNMESSAEL